jgi:hypothetical protein
MRKLSLNFMLPGLRTLLTINNFWSGTRKNLALEDHETLNIVEHGYELLYRTWGPSMLRRLDVELNGYEYCKGSGNPLMRDHRSLFFRKECGMIWTLLAAMEKFAPNGIVRRRACQADSKYRRIIGEPTPIMKFLSSQVVRLAGKEYSRLLFDPSYHSPKQEPFKKYTYDKAAGTESAIPYKTDWPGKPCRKIRADMRKEAIRYILLEAAIKWKKISGKDNYDHVIDGYLMRMVENRAFGFGL